MEQKGFAIPEHTQTPNSFFDVTLPQIKSIGELKVLLAIMRQTFGWRKFTDTISLSQLVKITGLSRQGVMNGLQLALEHGFIERSPHGQSFTYGLKLLVKEVDQSSKLTSQVSRPEVVKEVDHQLVKQVDPQKKEKEKKEREPRRDDLFEALASVCRIDWQLCTSAQRSQLNQSTKILRDAGRTPQQVALVGEWWFRCDWRGRKGEAPKPAQVREVWAQAFNPARNRDEHPNAWAPGKNIT